MHKLHTCLLATACLALVGAAGFAPSASATTCYGDTNCSLGANPYTFGTNDVYGGGSSLVAPYWRQTSDCYGLPADLITKGSPPTFVDESLFNWTGSHPQNCATTEINPTATTWYISTGSGSGILGVFGHDPVTFWGQVNTNNGGQTFPEAFYALSDAGLGSTDLAAYNSGTGSGTYCQGSTCITIAAPGAQPCTGEQNGVYPNPAGCFGPLVQFPFSVDPVTNFYTNGGIYEKVAGPGQKEIDYKLHVVNGTKNGGLRLSVNSFCGIWNGQITSWNDPQLTADNNNTPLEDLRDPTPAGQWNPPVYAVGRSDGSGTTSIITRHLAAICTNYTLHGQQGVNYYNLGQGATTLQGAGASAIIGNTYNVNNPNFPGVDETGKITLAPNSSGVAQYVAFTQSPANEKNQCTSQTVLPSGYSDCIQQGRIGYVGADYVMPYVKNSKTNSYNLFAADLQNSSGNYLAPSPKAALVAFTVLPPQSNSNGTYCSSCTQNGMRNDPTAWVESLSASVPLANPSESNAYPLVGTTNFLGYTCYMNSGNLDTLIGQLGYVDTGTINTNAKGILGSAGLSPLPKAWLTAIGETFINNKDNLGLNMTTVGTGTICSASGIYGA